MHVCRSSRLKPTPLCRLSISTYVARSLSSSAASASIASIPTEASSVANAASAESSSAWANSTASRSDGSASAQHGQRCLGVGLLLHGLELAVVELALAALHRRDLVHQRLGLARRDDRLQLRFQPSLLAIQIGTRGLGLLDGGVGSIDDRLQPGALGDVRGVSGRDLGQSDPLGQPSAPSFDLIEFGVQLLQRQQRRAVHGFGLLTITPAGNLAHDNTVVFESTVGSGARGSRLVGTMVV